MERTGDLIAAGMLKIRTNENLNQVNQELEKLAARYGYQFIDVNAGIKDEQGKLRGDLTINYGTIIHFGKANDCNVPADGSGSLAV